MCLAGVGMVVPVFRNARENPGMSNFPIPAFSLQSRAIFSPGEGGSVSVLIILRLFLNEEDRKSWKPDKKRGSNKPP